MQPPLSYPNTIAESTYAFVATTESPDIFSLNSSQWAIKLHYNRNVKRGPTSTAHSQQTGLAPYKYTPGIK
jgi:hypothetical protein